MRRFAHLVLVLLAGLPWVIGYFAFATSALLVWVADKVWPEADHGNCWSYAGPRWLKHGGYLAVRVVPSAKFLGAFPVLHAVLLHQMPDGAVLEMTMPLRRQKTKWLPWRTFYFHYRVARKDRAISDWADL